MTSVLRVNRLMMSIIGRGSGFSMQWWFTVCLVDLLNWWSPTVGWANGNLNWLTVIGKTEIGICWQFICEIEILILHSNFIIFVCRAVIVFIFWRYYAHFISSTSTESSASLLAPSLLTSRSSSSLPTWTSTSSLFCHHHHRLRRRLPVVLLLPSRLYSS